MGGLMGLTSAGTFQAEIKEVSAWGGVRREVMPGREKEDAGRSPGWARAGIRETERIAGYSEGARGG